MSSTLNFKELSLQNFLSYGNSPTIIDLSNPGTTGIEGRNLDKEGSNGSGKTGILNGLCYALYNKPFDTISLQKLINSTNSSKNTLMEVRLTFERAGDEYEIVRSRGEQYTISITKNGDDITPGKGVIECDALIESIIGISYELFTKTIIFSGNETAFLKLPVAQQRALIEELFNISLLSEKAELLRKNIKLTEGDLKVQEAVVKQQEVAAGLYLKHLRDAEYRISVWDSKHHEEIEHIKQMLTTIDSVDFETELLVHAEKSNLTQEGMAITAKLAPAKKDQQQLTREVQKLLTEQEHLEVAKCPYCLQKYADAPLKLTELEVSLTERGNRLLTVEGNVTILNEQLKLQQARLQEVNAAIKHPNLTELLAARENATALTQQLASLTSVLNPHFEAYERLEVDGPPVIETEKIDAFKKRLEHQAFLLKLLVNKDSFLRQRIINKLIPFLNDRINEYTQKIGLPHIVRFAADMSCTVSEFGRELDFGQISAGEKKRVSIALVLAFRDVLHHLHAKSNLMIVDELDGQLDGPGIDAIIRTYKEKSRDEELSVFIISHSPHVQGRLDRTMIVTKQHGFSSVSDG